MAILFSDIMNYTSLMGKDEKHALNILEENRKIHQRSMTNYNGTILKEIGDGTLPAIIRYWIFTANNDVFEDGVNIASKIHSVALYGAVAVSEAVYNNIKNRMKKEVVFAGEKQSKNIEESVKIYQVNIAENN